MFKGLNQSLVLFFISLKTCVCLFEGRRLETESCHLFWAKLKLGGWKSSPTLSCGWQELSFPGPSSAASQVHNSRKPEWAAEPGLEPSTLLQNVDHPAQLRSQANLFIQATFTGTKLSARAFNKRGCLAFPQVGKVEWLLCIDYASFYLAKHLTTATTAKDVETQLLGGTNEVGSKPYRFLQNNSNNEHKQRLLFCPESSLQPFICFLNNILYC